MRVLHLCSTRVLRSPLPVHRARICAGHFSVQAAPPRLSTKPRRRSLRRPRPLPLAGLRATALLAAPTAAPAGPMRRRSGEVSHSSLAARSRLMLAERKSWTAWGTAREGWAGWVVGAGFGLAGWFVGWMVQLGVEYYSTPMM